MSTQLLQRFRDLYEGTEYHHRRSNLGDLVAQHLYEDIYTLDQSRKLQGRIDAGDAVLNASNLTHGVEHRRGDGSFGTIIPGEDAVRDMGFHVARGPLATIQIGAEVKIVSKAMIRQVGRVISDLGDMVRHFQKSNPDVITVGIVGVNHAEKYRSFEGDREWVTTGKGRHKHPVQEAGKAIAKLQQVRPAFDEFLLLRFRATNLPPFPFEWVDEREARQDYSSALVRIAAEYERRF